MVPSLKVLQDSGIEIEEDPRYITPLPPYAEDLRKLLLNFTEIVPHTQPFFFCKQKHTLSSLLDLDRQLTDIESPLPQTIYRDCNHKLYQDRWVAALELRDKAKHLDSRQKEASWNALLANFVFENINNQASDQGIFMRDLLSWGSNETFTNAFSIREQLSDQQGHQPKPDFWFGLGLYSDEQLSRLKGLETKDKGIRYFTQESLKHMSRNHGNDFVYQPVKSTEHGAFPWMVVELKKELGDEPECLRQAANACHTCLVLCERLAAPTARDASPIVAFTSIGPKAKVFIAYKSGNADDECYRMSCIWSGHIQNILHAVQLRSIVDQLMFWALRIFKPWVTECLEHWYEEDANKYEFIYPIKSTYLAFEMLINSIRMHKSTQTSPRSRGRRQSFGFRSERHASSNSDVTESDQIDPESAPASDRSQSPTSESESDRRPQSQSASNRSSLSHSSRLGESDLDSSPVPTMPVQDNTDSAPASDRSQSSNWELDRLFRTQSESASNRSSLSYSYELGEEDPESSHVPTMPVQDTPNQSTSEVEVRLREIRARVRKACIGSLILTNRVHSLSQKITLGQMRSHGS